jgi:hypothetical protein
METNEYVKRLGYTELDPEHSHRSSGTVQCDHGTRFPAYGNVMRGHRRRCTVKSWDPHTPGVCDA